MKRFLIPLIAIVFLLFAVEGYAVDLFSVGESGDDNLLKITQTAIIEGARGDYQVIATNDTLTAIESGIVTIVQGAKVTPGPVEVQLPAASLGLRYTIVAGATTETIEVQPQDADTIVYPEVTLEGSRLLAGYELDSPGETADSVTLICGAANTWFVESMKGVWTNGGSD